jgi:conjugative relaxase-like TrwC/TraI family protein
MTVRVTTLKGTDAGSYYVDALPNYYLDADEPRGHWHGKAATVFGLRCEVGDDEFLNLMAGAYPHDDSLRLGRAYGENSVRGFDITASAPKSMSVLFAVGSPQVRADVLASHDTGVQAIIQWVQNTAHTRFRINGEVATVDAEGAVAATFRQHTSRALHPQLHTHIVVPNRVLSPDGRWLALDARTLKLDQRTASSIYHATMRTELTTRLGVEFEPVVNGIADIAHFPPEVLAEFSTRTAAIDKRLDAKIDRFVDTFDRDPTPRERWRLEREAVTDSRPAKAKEVNAAELHDRWASQLGDLGISLGALERFVMTRTPGRTLTERDWEIASNLAMNELERSQSSWRPAELSREIARQLPTNTTQNTADFVDRLEAWTQRTIGEQCIDISRLVPIDSSVRRDGRPYSEPATDRALTTTFILEQEDDLAAWAERRNHVAGVPNTRATERSAVELSGPQAQAAAAVAGDADLVMVVGPAGTGKTTALAPAVAQLQAEGRVVFGVAPSAAAADVLHTETGVRADTIDKLLHEHQRLDGPSKRFDLPSGSTLIVDEAGMVSTSHLAHLTRLADRKHWRVALVGDSMQFSAIGRGGMFQHLLDTHEGIELDTVRRFHNPWERAASLQLRRGNPDIINTYDTHYRIQHGTSTRMDRDAINQWLQHRRDGEDVLLLAPSNETVSRLNHTAQAALIQNGQLDAGRWCIETPAGDRLHVGDEIVSRRNQRTLTTTSQHSVKNRDRWTITGINADSSITAARTDNGHETVRLPANYVQQHVELGYAQTSHAAQGRTVDHALLVLDTPTNSPGIYVALTRGRHSNTAYITAPDHPTALDTIRTAVTNQWIDQPARVRQHDLAGGPRLPGQLPADEIGRLRQRQDHLAKIINNARPELARARRQLKDLSSSRSGIVERLAATRGQLEDARAILANYDRPLHRRKHRTAIDNANNDIDQLPNRKAELEHDLAETDQAEPQMKERIAHLEDLNTQLPDLTTEYNDTIERLQHHQSIEGPARTKPTLQHDLAHSHTRPSNQDLRNALDQIHSNRPDQPDLGISI